jgi:membrane-bound metal-dependent hydrolase YbcI (DUF457 family)
MLVLFASMLSFCFFRAGSMLFVFCFDSFLYACLFLSCLAVCVCVASVGSVHSASVRALCPIKDSRPLALPVQH